MGIQQFLGYYLSKDQKILSMMGPSGTGKSFSAEFLQEYLDYKVAKQLTTRDPRPDDKHYRYISREEFVRLENEGKILGIFAGDKQKLQGNGYGYLSDEVMEQLSKDNKLILFSSAYELQKSDFREKYGTSDKIGLAFKDPQVVLQRALQCNKALSEKDLQSRIKVAVELSRIMEEYDKTGDKTFNLIYSDSTAKDLRQSKNNQISKIVNCIGYNSDELQDSIEEYISR